MHVLVEEEGTIITECQRSVSCFCGENVVETITDSYSLTLVRKNALVIKLIINVQILP